MAQPDPKTRTRRRWLVVLIAVVAVAGIAVVAVQAGVLERRVGGSQVEATDRFDGAGEPAADAEAAVPVGRSEEQQAALVEAEDDRLFSIASDVPATAAPYEVAAGGQAVPTVVLTARSRPYDLAALERLGAAARLPDGTWLLSRSVVVARGAELRIQEPGATLRLASGPGGFAAIVVFKGTLVLAGGPGAPLAVTSWDEAAGAADTDRGDGRAYIRSVGARLDLTQVDVADLGFWSGRTGGVAWTGSSSGPATGSATEVTVERGHYGLFTSRAADVVVNDTTLRDNHLEGLLLHRETTGFVGRGITSTGNGRDGVAIDRGAERVTLTEVIASDNGDNGIRIDGSPLAETATAGGASTAQGAGYTVERSVLTGNAGAGILVVAAGEVALRDNTVAGSPDGIVLRGPADGPVLTGNTVDAGDFGIAVRDGIRDAQLTGNRIGSAVIGVQVTDASATIRDNEIVAASRYGVSLVGQVSGSSVTTTTLGGRGLAALDVNRVAPTATVGILGNDDSGWTTDRDELQYWRDYAVDHPLLLLWLLILVLPFAARMWTKRRHRLRAEHAHPYRNVAPGPTAPGNTDVISSIGRPGPRPVQPAPRTTTPQDASATVALPVTRVTVVSGEGARR